MTGELMSKATFEWIVTILTGGVAGGWFLYDGIRLAQMTRTRSSDPVMADKKFGYMMGVVIGLAGVWGCLRFHGVVG